MLDIGDPDAIRRVVREIKPDVIVNAAAYTAVDKAESEPQLAMQVNGVAPGILAEEAKRSGSFLVHYSTDYILNGEKRAPYTESDSADPINTYGRTKLEGERRIADAGLRHLIIRTSWVYGPRGHNFYMTIRRRAGAGERLRVVDDQIGVPTTAGFLAEQTIGLLRSEVEGVLNVVPSGSTSWFGFAREIVERSGAPTAVDAIASSEFPAAARRPSYSVLASARAEAMLGTAFRHWSELLAAIIAGKCAVRR